MGRMNVQATKKRVRSKPSKKAKRKPAYTTQKPVLSLWSPVAPKSGVGNSLLSTFIYSSKFAIDPATLGLAGLYQFSLTNLFDPDITGVGIQPIPYDQYSSLYERYRVYEVEWKISFINSSANDCFCGYQVNDQATTSGDYDRFIQNGQAMWEPLARAGSASDTVTLHGSCDVAKVHGITRKRLFSDDSFAAVFGTNPAEQLFLNVFAFDSNISDAAVIRCFIELRYKASLEGNQLTLPS